MAPHNAPASRIPPDWLPFIVGGATCVLAAGIIYSVYAVNLTTTFHRRTKRGRPARKRHLDIDIDLSNPLGTPIQPLIHHAPPHHHHHHHIHDTDELLNVALAAAAASSSSSAAAAAAASIAGVAAGVGVPMHGQQGLPGPAQVLHHRRSTDLDREVMINSPWNDGAPSHPLSSSVESVSLSGYHLPSAHHHHHHHPSSSSSASASSAAASILNPSNPAISNHPSAYYYQQHLHHHQQTSGHAVPLLNTAASAAAAAVQHLDPNLVRSIVERLLDSAPLEPPVGAFAGAVAGLSGRPAYGGRHPGLAIREDTQLPPFEKQIDHLITEIRTAKQRGKPLLVEGIPGLGKATALQKWVWEEGQQRPAIYLQLSMVLRRRHGGSSLEDDEDVAAALGYGGAAGGGSGEDFYTETETENEGVEERVALSVRRDAFRKALEQALGVDSMEASMLSMTDSMLGTPTTTHPNGTPLDATPSNADADDDDDDDDASSPYGRPMDMTNLEHIAQALRLIAAKSKHGPTLFVLDDVQLLFRERAALSEKYDGIGEVFGWLLRCEREGILDCVLCSSEKSAVGGVKRLRGYDWGLALHSVDGVEDDVIIEYLLRDVNPKIKEPQRRFTEETAALFVATFNGSLLELDNYFRDVNSNVFSE
ncbi:hypothetical protein HDU67_009202 [Dinochytrium kinnereticum]|nr:hypothetical protein HDU67_009202 [Dinochytrium kinnereticum]